MDVQGAEVVRPYTEKFQVRFPVAVDTADIFGAAFDLKAIPVTFLVDEVGILRLQGGGPDETLQQRIEAILEEPLMSIRAVNPTLPSARTPQELESAVEKNPADWQSRLALARVYGESERVPDAIAQLAKASELQPGQAEISFVWGQILLNRGHKDEALKKLRTARDLAPDNWRIRKQIWAIEHPDKFYTEHSPDYGWQSRQLATEKEEKRR